MISVLICTYNRSGELKKTLKSLEAMVAPLDLRWELLVIDNNSNDDTRAVVEEFARTAGFTVRYVFTAEQGLCHARNTGIREAKGDILVFTDDDITVDSYWLLSLQDIFARFACMGVAGKIVPLWTCEKPVWLEQMEAVVPLNKVIVSFDLGEELYDIQTPPFGANMAFRK